MEKMEKKIAKRSSNWEQEEKDVLSKLVMDKLETIENSKIDTNTNKKKKDAWNSVHQLFNSSSETKRTLEQIQSQWRKMKSVAKTKNSLFLKQKKQTGGGPPPEPLSSLEEELITRIPKQFEHDYNVYDSNSVSQELPEQVEGSTTNNDISKYFLAISSEDEAEVSYVEEVKASPKRKKKVKDDESVKRIKLLDISILQKENEIKYSKIQSHAQNNFDTLKKKVLDLQFQQMIEEHNLKMEKLKLELENLKKSGFFK